MITLPDKIKNDLSSSAYQLQYLLEIGTDTPILIGTRKQNLLYQYIEDYPEGYSLSEELFEQPLTYGSWSGSDPEYDYENDNIVINNPSVYRELVPGDTYSHAISYGRTYECTFEISGDFNTPNYHFFWIGHHNYYRYYFNAEGTYTVIIPINTTAFVNSRAGFINLQGATLHSLSIKEIITTEAYSVHRDKYLYYEDANMKVSNLKEKIDLKTKKIQYSDLTFTLSNIEGINGRLSDNLDTIYGADINLYAITQSCDLTVDKLPIARLKATRMDHDDTTVKISANDRNLEGFYVNLPKTLLEKDVNTYEAYNLKPVPILYGHLENAPAAVYIDNYQKTNLLVDDAFFSDDKDIEGINQYNIEKQDGFNLPYSSRWRDEMIETNCVKIKLDNTMANVLCRPYINTRQEIIDIYDYPQYETYHDYIHLLEHYNGDTTLYPNAQALWCSANKLTKFQNGVSYQFFGDGSKWYEYHEDTYGDNLLWLKTNWLSASLLESGEEMGHTYQAGIQQYVFENISGVDLYDPESFPQDIHYFGNLALSSEAINDGDDNDKNIRIVNHYSPYEHDPYEWDDQTGQGFGTPAEYTSIGYYSQNQPDSEYSAYIGSSLDEGQYKWSFQRLYLYGHAEISQQYASYLYQTLSINEQPWDSDFENLLGGLNKVMEATTLNLHYIVEPVNNEISNNPTTDIYVMPEWGDMQVRKTWANANIFENEFHVNARGRVDKDVQLDGVNRIRAKIKVLEEQPRPDDGDTNADYHRFSYQQKHQLELYKILTNKKFNTKIINGEIYQLMIKYDIPYSDEAYLWDIDVNNMSWSEDWGDLINGMYTPGETYRTEKRGWVYDITAKNYNLGTLIDDASLDYDFYWFRNIQLVYGKINWENENTISSIVEAEEQEEVALFNENKGWSNNEYAGLDPYIGEGYCHIIWLPEDMEENIDKPIDNALDIIKNIVFQEMGLREGNIDQVKLQESIIALKNSKMAFSINEEKKSKDIIEDICKQSRLTFRYRPSDGFTVLDSVKDQYDVTIDFDKELHINDMLSYKYSKTKVEDLCIGGCSVKWGWDYEKEENVSITEEINLSEDMLEQYKLFYGIIEEDNHKLELEAPYISDEASAIEFRNFMFQYYKNQHTILKCSLTIQQGFELEVGDVLKINSYEKVYGALLQDSKTIIDQEAYPLFYITSLTKSLDKVDMECVQLHNLSMEDEADRW